MRRKPQQQTHRPPQVRGGQLADGPGSSGAESHKTRLPGEATQEANTPARGETPP